jgi:hypothetical protein
MPRPKPPRIPHLSQQATILANLFEGAQAAVLPWGKFRWHSAAGEGWDTWKEHSSQALAIDVFGALQLSDQRDVVLDRLAAELALPTGGPWQVSLEWHDPHNYLKERQPTWVDAVAESPRSLIFFECKFTESDGGSCSQTQPLKTGPHKGLVQCNGSYMWQVNPATGREARCTLTDKGIRYWEVIPRVFDYADESYFECPFRGAWFQWMRNLTVCAEYARQRNLRPAFVVVYADAPSLPMARRVQSPEWQRLVGRLQSDQIAFQAIAFQTLTALAQAADPANSLWAQLADWVRGKIERVTEKRERR